MFVQGLGLQVDAALVVCLAVAIAAAITDLLTGRIPNLLTYPAILIGLGLAAWQGVPVFMGHLAAGLIAAIPFLLAFLYGGGGGGDVKIMAAVGALIGFPGILPVMAHALLVGAVMAVIDVVVQGRFKAVLQKARLSLLLLPFGPRQALGLNPVDLSEAAGTEVVPERAKGGVRFGLAVALGLIWTCLPVRWHLPGV